MYRFAVTVEEQEEPAEGHDQQQRRDGRPELPFEKRQIDAPENPPNRDPQEHEANRPRHRRARLSGRRV